MTVTDCMEWLSQGGGSRGRLHGPSRFPAAARGKSQIFRRALGLPAQRIDSGTEPPAPAAGSFKNHRVRPAATHSRSLRLEIVTVPVIPGT